MRDFVAFEEHVEGVRRSVDGAAGVVAGVVRRADLLLHQPARRSVGAHDDVPFPAGSQLFDFELEVAAWSAATAPR